MKASKRIAITVALALIAAGIILAFVSLAITKFSFEGAFTIKYVTSNHPVSEDFSSIDIDVSIADICFIVSDNGEARVECYENDKRTHIVAVENGTLTVREQRNQNVFNFFSFDFNTPRVTLYLSRTDFDALTINSSTSLTVVPQEFSFKKSSITASTGNVSYQAPTSGELAIRATTGRIMVSGISPASVDLKATTGTVSLTSVNTSGSVSISTSTGKIHIKDVKCQEMELKSSTGNKELSGVKCQNIRSKGSTGHTTLSNVIADEHMRLETTTGNIALELCDAAALDISTDTGNVSGTLLSEKIFYAESDTGRVRVPHTTSGGKCEIRSDTGDIIITVEE